MKKFIILALEEAEKAASQFDEVPIGAVLVKDGDILAKAGNRTRTLNDPSAHAEMLVLREAAQKLGNYRLNGCDLYVTLEPCTMCAGAISHARIKTLIFGAEDEKGGAVTNGVQFFDSPTCHHKPDIISGIEQKACSALLTNFFKQRR